MSNTTNHPLKLVGGKPVNLYIYTKHMQRVGVAQPELFDLKKKLKNIPTSSSGIEEEETRRGLSVKGRDDTETNPTLGISCDIHFV